MIPMFAAQGGRVVLKPLLQLIFEQLYEGEVREFYIIVRRWKRAIEDHFTRNRVFVEALSSLNKPSGLEEFYEMPPSSRVVFMNQD